MKKQILGIFFLLIMLPLGALQADNFKQVKATTDNSVQTLPVMQRYGLLRLNILPGEANTIVNGKYLDKNVWLISMKPGKHHILIEKNGYEPYQKSFEMSHGDRLTFNIELEKKANGET